MWEEGHLSVYTPENKHISCPLKKGPFHKKKACLPSNAFQWTFVSFRVNIRVFDPHGSTLIVREATVVPVSMFSGNLRLPR